MERAAWKPIHCHMQNREPMETRCVTRGTHTGALWQPRGWGGMGGGRDYRREGTCVHLWLSHVDMWQGSHQYCNASILQLKINLKNKNKWKRKKEKKRNVKQKSLIMRSNSGTPAVSGASPSPEPTWSPRIVLAVGSDQEGPALVRGTQSGPPCERLSRHVPQGKWEWNL